MRTYGLAWAADKILNKPEPNPASINGINRDASVGCNQKHTPAGWIVFISLPAVTKKRGDYCPRLIWLLALNPAHRILFSRRWARALGVRPGW